MAGIKLSGLGEFGWLRRLLPRLFWPHSLHPQLCIGPGDDAGVLRISRSRVLVATTDAMVEGVHFDRRWFPWEYLGEKILAVNLSDLAAMGKVKPLAALVSAGFPGDTPVDNVDKLYQGLESCARRWKTGFLGGDTVGSPDRWFLSVTVLGEADPRQLVRRSTARAGDLIAISGPLGLAAAGLEVLQAGERSRGARRPVWTAPLVEAFFRPQPRFAAAALLAENRWATSLMDSSDGLEASVRILAQASGVGAEIELEKLPVPKPLSRWAGSRKRPAWEYALCGGEDYELVFTVHPRNWPFVHRRLPRAASVGRILPNGRGCWAVSAQKRVPLQGYGFAHFKNR